MRSTTPTGVAKRAADPEAIRGVHRTWMAANPGKSSEYNRRRKVRAKGAEGRHTVADIEALWARYGGLCAYCGAPAEHVDHVMPLSRGGSDWPWNLAPACLPCNLSKKDKHPDRWYGELIGRQR